MHAIDNEGWRSRNFQITCKLSRCRYTWRRPHTRFDTLSKSPKGLDFGAVSELLPVEQADGVLTSEYGGQHRCQSPLSMRALEGPRTTLREAVLRQRKMRYQNHRTTIHRREHRIEHAVSSLAERALNVDELNNGVRRRPRPDWQRHLL